MILKLKPDPIFENKSFEEHCSIVPEFRFKKEVPEDVVQNFEIVSDLLVFSYYRYKFIDEAYAKALTSFEMAMKIRLNDFKPGSRKVTFAPLVRTLSSLNLFDTDIHILNHLKDARNYYAHPERHSFGGIVVWNKIEAIARLVNEMYEDVELRMNRRRLFDEFNSQMSFKGFDKGFVICIDGTPHVLFKAILLFVNNKRPFPNYLIACTPIFDLAVERDIIKVPKSFKAQLEQVDYSGKTIKGLSYSHKKPIEFTPITSFPNLEGTYRKWFQKFHQLPEHNRFQFLSSLNYYFSDILSPELREFYIL